MTNLIFTDKNLTDSNLDKYNWDMKLDANENYIGASTLAVQAVKDLSALDFASYPENSPAYSSLKRMLAEFHKVDESSIVFTNGGEEAIASFIYSNLTVGDAVVAVTPFESNLHKYANCVGAKVQTLPYKNSWIYPLEDVKSALNEESNKVLFITTPNNPTGDIVSETLIAELAESFPDKIIVIDESYASFSGYTNVNLVKNYQNIVVIKSLSKDYGIAGLRFGYVVSNKQNISKISSSLCEHNVNIAALVAAEASLKDSNYVRFVANEIARSRAYLIEEIRKLGVNVYRSYGNFVLADFGAKSDLIYTKLKSNGILVKSYQNDSVLDGHLRITVPTLTASERIVALLKSRNTLVFDMDNVLFNVFDSVYVAIRNTYLHFTGKNLSNYDISRVRCLIGSSDPKKILMEIIKRSGFNFPIEEVCEIYENNYWINGSALIDNEELLLDVSFIEKLSRRFNLAICTERARHDTMFLLKKYNLDKFFNKVITSDDVPPSLGLPDTTPLLMIKEAFITDYLLYFCDTQNAAQAALKFNFATPIGILTQNSKSDLYSDTLDKIGVKIKINDFNELSQILELS